MKIRSALTLLVICTACHSGLMPCPKPQTVKLHKSFKTPPTSLISRASKPREEETQRNKDVRPSDARYVGNISMEEWDCPRPGAKRYLPKSVKENIRKNKKKFQDEREMQLDSLSSK
ncbi:MAG: hypothetical protein ABIS36_02600 [Chryseolinea sp.]